MTMLNHRAIRINAARGLTLIELLASLVILSLLLGAAGPWMVSTLRAQRTLTEHGAAQRHTDRAMRILQQDIDESVVGAIELDLDMNSVMLITAHALPGRDPGWRRVVWRLDPTSDELLRQETPVTGKNTFWEAIILRGVERFDLFEMDDQADQGPFAPRRVRVEIVMATGQSAAIFVENTR